MSYKIAIGGKGGVGKTTTTTLIIKWLSSKKTGSVLAVDADPNSNLNESLGLDLKDTIGNIRENMKDRSKIPAGLTKSEFVDYKINTSLIESEDFDFLAMGRPEGPGCYCFANNILKDAIHKLSNQYDYIVIDNEAGLENLSRRIVQEIDLFVLISDPSIKGVLTASRLLELSESLGVKTKNSGLIISRYQDSVLPPALKSSVENSPLKLLGILPTEPYITDKAASGASLLNIPETSSCMSKLDEIMHEIF